MAIVAGSPISSPSKNQLKINSPSKKKRNSCPGIRVKGARIYDSKDGKTCHQCRQKTLDFSAACMNQKEGKQCTVRFCHKCLLNRYGEQAEVVSQSGDWNCPRCRGICNCSVCMKRKGFQPTGQLISTAKASGFSSVSHMLQVGPVECLSSEKAVQIEAVTTEKEISTNITRKKDKENMVDGKIDPNFQADPSSPVRAKRKSEKVAAKVVNKKQNNKKRQACTEIHHNEIKMKNSIHPEERSSKKSKKVSFEGDEPTAVVETTPKKSETKEPIVVLRSALKKPKTKEPAAVVETTPKKSLNKEPTAVVETTPKKSLTKEPAAVIETTPKKSETKVPIVVVKSALKKPKTKEPIAVVETTPKRSLTKEPTAVVETTPKKSETKEPTVVLKNTLKKSRTTEIVSNEEGKGKIFGDKTEGMDNKKFIQKDCSKDLGAGTENIPKPQIPLPKGTELVNVSGIEIPSEDVGNVLQLLEFCSVFGKVIDVKKGQAESVVRDILHGRTLRRGKCSSTVQFIIQLLSVIYEDEEDSPPLSPGNGKNSWIHTLKECISDSHDVAKLMDLDLLEEGTYVYESLSSSKKLKLLNFLCDEILGTSKIRDWIDEQAATFAEKAKEAKSKVLAAKDKEKQLRQKMQDDIATAVIANNGAPLSISEHEAIMSKIKHESAEARAEVLESQLLQQKGNQTCDATRIENILLDATDARAYWRLKSSSYQSDILGQDLGSGDTLDLKEKWFSFDDEQKAAIEKHISLLGMKRLRAKRLRNAKPKEVPVNI